MTEYVNSHKPLVVFDLDGTLSDDTRRQRFLARDPADWEAYHAACGSDGLIYPVYEVFDALISADDFHIEIWTGRMETVREETLEWLDFKTRRQPGIGKFDQLRMRPEGDFRKDAELKGDWLADVREAGGDVQFAFEDRNHMAAWWREQGVFCFHVADHGY